MKTKYIKTAAFDLAGTRLAAGLWADAKGTMFLEVAALDDAAERLIDSAEWTARARVHEVMERAKGRRLSDAEVRELQAARKDTFETIVEAAVAMLGLDARPAHWWVIPSWHPDFAAPLVERHPKAEADA